MSMRKPGSDCGAITVSNNLLAVKEQVQEKSAAERIAKMTIEFKLLYVARGCQVGEVAEGLRQTPRSTSRNCCKWRCLSIFGAT